MFPVLYGERKTRQSIFYYTLILITFSQAISFSEIGGPVFFLLSNALNASLLLFAIKLIRINDRDGYEQERKFFKFTILYLFLYFSFLVINKGLDFFVSGLSSSWPVLL